MLPIILIVVVIVYLVLPAWLEFILILINIFVPDPVPYLDEILMILPVIVKVQKIKNKRDTKKENKRINKEKNNL